MLYQYFFIATLALLTVGIGGPILTDMMTHAIEVQLEMQAQQLENLRN